jgi:anthranilate synthase component 2
MSILVFDNYDSFTFNIVHYIEQLTDMEVEVHRNDKISLREIERFDKILLSPGPGLPSEAGILLPLIKTYAFTKSIFGVCLGMQAIVEAFGGSLFNTNHVFHGISTPIEIVSNDLLFNNLPKKFNVGRYHSWMADNNKFPAELEIIAIDQEENVMALKHRKYDVRGVQFHPESILTENGLEIFRNWLI